MLLSKPNFCNVRIFGDIVTWKGNTISTITIKNSAFLPLNLSFARAKDNAGITKACPIKISVTYIAEFVNNFSMAGSPINTL